MDNKIYNLNTDLTIEIEFPKKYFGQKVDRRSAVQSNILQQSYATE